MVAVEISHVFFSINDILAYSPLCSILVVIPSSPKFRTGCFVFLPVARRSTFAGYPAMLVFLAILLWILLRVLLPPSPARASLSYLFVTTILLSGLSFIPAGSPLGPVSSLISSVLSNLRYLLGPTHTIPSVVGRQLWPVYV